MIGPWVVVALSVVVSAGLTYAFKRPGSPLYVLDHPNERSLHDRPVPKVGGIAIIAAILLGIGAGGIGADLVRLVPAFVVAFLLVATVGFSEDRVGVPAGVRLVVHLAAGTVMVMGGFTVTRLVVPGIEIVWPWWLAAPMTIVFVAWMINLYNFMDGVDGLAAGMGMIGFGTFAVLGWLAGDAVYMTASLAVAGAAGGFLVFNFPPARAFMGDTGSSALGVLVAGFILWGSYLWIVPIWISVLVFSPFIVDATATLVRRMIRKEPFWRAHRSHYYQRLVHLGWRHRDVMLAEYLLMITCSGAAMYALRSPPSIKWLILASVAVVYIVCASAIALAEPGGIVTTQVEPPSAESDSAERHSQTAGSKQLKHGTGRQG